MLDLVCTGNKYASWFVSELLLCRDEDERFEVAVDDNPGFDLHPVVPALTQYAATAFPLLVKPTRTPWKDEL